jgi:hypothetical protein
MLLGLQHLELLAVGSHSPRFKFCVIFMIYLGSVAAGLQSSIYGGLTTGLFSTCQSIGATWVVGSGSIISGIGSLAAGASILGSSSGKTKTEDDSDSESEASDLAGSNRSISPPPYSES